jgi:hypothetical protein
VKELIKDKKQLTTEIIKKKSTYASIVKPATVEHPKVNKQTSNQQESTELKATVTELVGLVKALLQLIPNNIKISDNLQSILNA